MFEECTTPTGKASVGSSDFLMDVLKAYRKGG